MGWEARGKNRYYYQKIRDGKHVVSHYVGVSTLAYLCEASDLVIKVKQFERRMQQKKHQDQVIGMRKMNAQIDQVERLVGAIVQSAMLMNGYHTHRRQWRKKRCQN